MQLFSLDDPEWFTTFPCLVTPRQEEWFPSLLLRSDEANHWESKKTLSSSLFPYRQQYPTDPPLFVVAPDILNLEYLAQVLAISKEDLLSTTYYIELSRLYGVSEPLVRYLYPDILFHLCPECLAQNRILRRFLVLPYITICPHHQLVLAETCLCGTQLQLFNRKTQPFTCSLCRLDWSKLPRIKSSPDQELLEQRYLSYYEFFLQQGSPKVLQYARALISEKQSPRSEFGRFSPPTWSQHLERARRIQPMALGFLIHNLVFQKISLDDIVSRL